MTEDFHEGVKKTLSNAAFARFTADKLFSRDDFARLERLAQIVPKREIRIGDVGEENNLDVGRFMVDRKGELPVPCNEPLGSEALSLLSGPRARSLFTCIMDGAYWIRRCQANRLRAGCFIGRHVDTYSNFDYRYSVVLQFSRDFSGGSFFVEQAGRDTEIHTQHADVLINRCEVPHGVRRVTAGDRLSMVFFLSSSPPDVPNLHHRQI